MLTTYQIVRRIICHEFRIFIVLNTILFLQVVKLILLCLFKELLGSETISLVTDGLGYEKHWDDEGPGNSADNPRCVPPSIEKI